MESYVIFLAFFLSIFFHVIVQNFFIKKKYFDDFNHRTSHKTIATRSGGISIFSSLFLISILFYFLKIELFDYSLFIPLGILFTIGVYDDLYQADFKIKFLMQLIVAKILIDQGFAIVSLHGFLGIYEIPWVLSQLITAIGFIIIVNAYNFIDGIDGLAISETVKNLFFFLYILLPDDPLYDLGFILLFTCIPFYFFNFKKKRKIFLGDAGSLFLGGINIIFLFHILNPNVILSNLNDVNRILLSLAILIYPLADLIRVVIIRIKNKKSPFTADQNHLHHWLISKNFSHFNSTLLIISLSIILLLIISLT